MTREEYVRTGLLLRIAHDLRGAASVTAGALDAMELGLADGENIERVMAIARRGLMRSMRIAESLSDAAELEAGSVALERARVDVGKLAELALERAVKLEPRRGIALEARCESAYHDVDVARLSRAVFELVDNAIRSARESVHLEVSAKGDAISIVISDDGAGCAPPQPRFTPTDQSRGLGLGLAFAVQVVALHGGTLEIDRVDDRTRVKLVLPR